ncbi:MAG: hypothetical protein AAFX99_07890, partial [Myxococcota bacterium]
MSLSIYIWALNTVFLMSFTACSGDDSASTGLGNACMADDECDVGERCEAGACVAAEGDAGTNPTDTGGDTQQQDTALPDTEEMGPGVGAPCDEGEDCPSGYCIESAAVSRRVCTDFCDPSDDTCPDGYTCAAVGNSGADVFFLCFPEVDLLCQPCEGDSDCGSLSDRCLVMEDGRFCGRDCRLQACPEDFSCVELVEDGQTLAQCRPTAGFCSACFDPDGDEFGQGEACLG